MIKYNIAAINCCTETEGPNKRMTIWFQGCDINCDGCCNPDYQAFVPKNILSIDELLDIVSKARDNYGIEGVTYSGGEPTLQQHLPELTNGIKKLGLGVISFTGKQYDDVKSQLQGCDIVLDGSFDKNAIDKQRRVLGSTNQRIINLTHRYDNSVNWFNFNGTKNIEINIASSAFANGDSI